MTNQTNGGLSVPLAGVVGGAIGAVVTLLLTLAIVGIVLLCIFCKTRRERARIRTPIGGLQVMRTPSQRYSHSMEKKNKKTTVPVVPTLDENVADTYTTVEDSKHYSSTVQTFQATTASHSQPVPKSEAVGEFGIMDNSSFEDAEQYELMLATATNPAYRNVPHVSPQTIPADIYEHLP